MLNAAAARAVLLLALFFGHAAQAAFLPSSAGCPNAIPSPDGSSIFPTAGAGQNSCVLTDALGFSWQYQGGNTLFINSGGGFAAYSSHYLQLQINSSGKTFLLQSCSPSPNLIGTDLWHVLQPGGVPAPAVSPTQLVSPGPFVNNTSSTTYASFFSMATAPPANGSALEVKPLSGGLPIWQDSGRISSGLTGLTLTLDAGAVLGCSADEANAIIPFESGNNNITITGSGTLAYGRDPSSGQYRAINIGNATGFTLGSVTIRDNDFGIQAGGDNGTVTFSGAMFDHNGSALNGSATHNIYMSTTDFVSETSGLIISGGYSVCTNQAGFQVKSRYPVATFQNFTAGAPSQHGYTDCQESAAYDFSCGGYQVIGSLTAGQGAVVEVGPNLGTNGNELIRTYREENATGNCPSGGWSNAQCQAATLARLGVSHNCALILQNAWVINDSGRSDAAMHVFSAGPNSGATFPAGYTITVSHSKIVCGFSPCNSSFLMAATSGVTITDDGTNTYFTSRAAAGLAACPSLASCPLPSPS